MITGKDLMEWGFTPGSWFKEALIVANGLKQLGCETEEIQQKLRALAPQALETIKKQDGSTVPCHYNLDVNDEGEIDNLRKVREHMEELAVIPTIRALSVMPDACPSGSQLGTIPVGAVAVAENAIHPGMHSNDICCSVAISILEDCDPTSILDAGMKITHFGEGGRQDDAIKVPDSLLAQFEGNKFLKKSIRSAKEHFGTQGNGNHFYYVGRLESTGQVALVTHHGSRKPGAELYKMGIAAAWEHSGKLCPDIPKYNAWIPFETEDGEAYWQALQLIREWTKENHYAIHDAVAKHLGLKLIDRFWNEHNFCFRRGNYFYHAKGATPNYSGFAYEGDHGYTLIPLNMAAPILICETHQDPNWGLDFSEKSLGFCPHGAGRNFSRTGFMNSLATQGLSPKQMIADYTSRYDIRAFSGKYDISEFPEAYKTPETIIGAIEKYQLTTLVDRVMPVGSIMAGHSGWQRKR